jgi:hypothetical protein
MEMACCLHGLTLWDRRELRYSVHKGKGQAGDCTAHYTATLIRALYEGLAAELVQLLEKPMIIVRLASG